MAQYEYKVTPAPKKGRKTQGARTTEDRFAHALEDAINAWAAEGWEYLRADTLPCEEREGLMGRTTAFQNMLVFRRAVADPAVHKPEEDALDPPETPVLIADQRDAAASDDDPQPKPAAD